MTLNYIWYWGSSSGDLVDVEYPFIAITPRSTLIQNASTIKGSSRSIQYHSYSIGPYTKKSFKETTTQKCKYELTMNVIP